MRIVIVDDDMLVAGALKTILEADKDVTVAGTGQDGGDALGLYRQHLPDVLLMDIRSLPICLRHAMAVSAPAVPAAGISARELWTARKISAEIMKF